MRFILAVNAATLTEAPMEMLCVSSGGGLSEMGPALIEAKQSGAQPSVAAASTIQSVR